MQHTYWTPKWRGQGRCASSTGSLYNQNSRYTEASAMVKTYPLDPWHRWREQGLTQGGKQLHYYCHLLTLVCINLEKSNTFARKGRNEWAPIMNGELLLICVTKSKCDAWSEMSAQKMDPWKRWTQDGWISIPHLPFILYCSIHLPLMSRVIATANNAYCKLLAWLATSLCLVLKLDSPFTHHLFSVVVTTFMEDGYYHSSATAYNELLAELMPIQRKIEGRKTTNYHMVYPPGLSNSSWTFGIGGFI